MVKQLILIPSLTRKDGRPTANLFDFWQHESISTEISFMNSLALFQSWKAEYAH